MGFQIDSRRIRGSWLVFITAFALLALAAPAHAAFPGTNGKIAFGRSVNNGSTYQIYTMNPDGSAQTNVSNNTAVDDREPAWSADGTKLAFMRFPVNGNGTNIYSMNADGSGQTQLTNSNEDGTPAWSPDGSKIAFSRCAPLGPCQIYTMNPDGTGQTNISNTPTSEAGPAWSPDGHKIAFTRPTASSPAQIFLMNPDGTNQVNISNNSNQDGGPSWSPDGTKIVFGRFDTSTSVEQIYTMNADGSNQTLVSKDPAMYDEMPKWSPDGTKIGFVRFTNVKGQIFTMNPDGLVPTDLSNSPSTSDEWPDWQPIPYTGYARPRGATPLITYLVPAYKQCAAPNSSHGAPLSFPSCNPPVQTSNFLTVGTPDSNGLPADTIGSVTYNTLVGNSSTSADVKIDVRITGVLNKTLLTPYNGGLTVNSTVRITDKQNNSANPSATMVDLPFPVDVPCASSLCTISTTENAIVPGAIVTGKRAIWELSQVQVFDGGSSGVPGSADATLFMDEGIFVP